MRAWSEAGPGALGFTGATTDQIQDISSERFLTQRIANPGVKIIIAQAGDSVVGFASLRAKDHHSVELSGIIVLQSASGAGVGTRLIRRALLLAAKLGFRSMVVRTEVFNHRALGFYRKNGFTETAKETEKVGQTEVEVRVLRKVLGRNTG